MDGFSRCIFPLLIIASAIVDLSLAENVTGFTLTAVTMPEETSSVKLGSTVELICEVYGLPQMNFVRWFRIDPITGHMHEMSINLQKSDNYKDITRMEIILKEISVEDNHFTFTLKMEDIEVGDQGQYMCLSQGTQELNDTIQIDIPANPSSISLSWEDGLSEGVVDGILRADEGATGKATCIVSGGYPAPSIKMKIGDEELKISEHVNVIEEEIDITNSISSTPNQFSKQAIVTGILEDFPITYNYGGSSLSCEAYSAVDSPVIATSVEIVLNDFRPQIDCPSSDVAFRINTKTVVLTCDVIAQPAITTDKSHVYFFDQSNGEEKTLVKIEEASEEDRYSFEITEMDGYKSQISFVIQNLNMTDFRDYYFMVGNTVGEVEATVKITEEKYEAVLNSADGFERANFTHFILISLLIISFINLL